MFLPDLAAGDTPKTFLEPQMSPFAAAGVTSESLKVSVPSGFKCQEEMAETNQSFGVEKRKRDNFLVWIFQHLGRCNSI